MSGPQVGIQLPEVERDVRWPEYLAMARTAEAVGFVVGMGPRSSQRVASSPRPPGRCSPTWSRASMPSTPTRNCRSGVIHPKMAPRGSGAMEHNVDLVVVRRFKRQGMRSWTREGADNRSRCGPSPWTMPRCTGGGVRPRIDRRCRGGPKGGSLRRPRVGAAIGTGRRSVRPPDCQGSDATAPTHARAGDLPGPRHLPASRDLSAARQEA